MTADCLTQSLHALDRIEVRKTYTAWRCGAVRDDQYRKRGSPLDGEDSATTDGGQCYSGQLDIGTVKLTLNSVN